MSEIIAGKYTTLSYIGVPGKMDAYTATTQGGEKVVVMTAEVRSQEDTDTFAARAQAVSALSHPDVAKIIDWGTDGARFYVAQAWVPGNDAATLLAQRTNPFSNPVVASFGMQAAAALSAAHARNIVHGDLRPQDLIVVEGEDIKVAGFGAPTTGGPVVLPVDAPARAAHYMSPEQAGGAAPTPASDVYSLGAVLYHLVTGEVPFDAATGLEVAQQHVQREPEPARRVNPEVSAALEAVLSKAMAKNPAQRYGSAEEMRADLERVAAGGDVAPGGETAVMPVVTTSPPKKRSSALGWTLGILAVLALVVGAWWFLFRGDIEVPDLTGMTLEEAQTAIEGAGLVLGDVNYDQNYPSDIAEGAVFGQTPAAGRMVTADSEITVTLAGGELTAIPDVSGMAESEAILAIRDAGFEISVSEREFDPYIESGSVIKQVPSGGTEAPKGSPVTLTISKGREVISVPGVTDETEADATATLEEAGLSVRVTEDYSDTVAEGSVISQAPQAGVSVDAGTQVTIVVSQGAEPAAQVSVPNVTGIAEAQAVSLVESAGLVADVSYVTDPDNAGLVTAQVPAMNTRVDEGSTVELTVGQ